MHNLLLVGVSMWLVVSGLDTDTDWVKFKAKYNKVYSHEEDAIRRAAWGANTRKITEHNEMYAKGKVSYYLGENKYADLTFDQFAHKMLGVHSAVDMDSEKDHKSTNMFTSRAEKVNKEIKPFSERLRKFFKEIDSFSEDVRGFAKRVNLKKVGVRKIIRKFVKDAVIFSKKVRTFSKENLFSGQVVGKADKTLKSLSRFSKGAVTFSKQILEVSKLCKDKALFPKAILRLSTTFLMFSVEVETYAAECSKYNLRYMDEHVKFFEKLRNVSRIVWKVLKKAALLSEQPIIEVYITNSSYDNVPNRTDKLSKGRAIEAGKRPGEASQPSENISIKAGRFLRKMDNKPISNIKETGIFPRKIDSIPKNKIKETGKFPWKTDSISTNNIKEAGKFTWKSDSIPKNMIKEAGKFSAGSGEPFQNLPRDADKFSRHFTEKTGRIRRQASILARRSPDDCRAGFVGRRRPLGVLPQKVDWRTKGYVTPVKDQGQCNSAWTFSATGAVEALNVNTSGQLISLSESNLIDCSQKFGSHGCTGGLPIQAYLYIINNIGIDSELSYPYVPREQSCRFNRSNVGAVMTYALNIPYGQESILQYSLVENGPASVTFNVNANFQLYKGGIFDDPSCGSKLDPNLIHSALVVGYDYQNSSGLWIVKNSWGKSWGENGYINMSKNKRNQCGIASKATFPIA